MEGKGKAESIADFLGESGVEPPDPNTEDLTPPLEDAIDLADSKAFSLAVLNSREFRRYVVNGLILGELPAAVITRMMDHGWGKPVERVEFEDKTRAIEGLSLEELHDRHERITVAMTKIIADRSELH